jgi:HNH endonuclease
MSKRRLRSEILRLKIAKRAENRCEYCRIHEDDMFIGFEIDHIIANKHGGGNEIENLAYACPHCNQHKGSDLVTFIDSYDDIVMLYHPRKHKWEEHFETNLGEIIAKTKIGKATIKLLKMNDIDLIILRNMLSEIGRYPL